jgi:hypothetical protein
MLSLVSPPKKPLPEFTDAELAELVVILKQSNFIGACVRAGLVKIKFSTAILDEDGKPKGWMFAGRGTQGWMIGRSTPEDIEAEKRREQSR